MKYPSSFEKIRRYQALYPYASIKEISEIVARELNKEYKRRSKLKRAA